MKRISILGSTGSIGVSTLDVVGSHPGEFTVTCLAGGRNIALLKQQTERFRPRLVAVIDEAHARSLRALLGSPTTEILSGPEGYREAAAISATDMVVSAMVGAAGLLPTLHAIEAGRDIALANKEALVMAGGIVLENATRKGVAVIPVDSEHSAIFQCLQGQKREAVRRIILTASGGPFLHASAKEMAEVKPAQALHHPNWTMGKKITIDSATMMNKGLEVIEASWLFGLPSSQIEILIHPQSIVHSMVEYRDGSVIAQLGVPDMRIPIAYALSYPRRLFRKEAGLDLAAVGTLAFSKPDRDRFPALRLAYAAAEAGGTMPAVLNAANEVAVTAFIDEAIGFNKIHDVVEQVLSRHCVRVNPGIDEILVADMQAREDARERIKGIKN
jgi:1-deoxy-D-xylulose-5-phosphate reductoisomerase